MKHFLEIPSTGCKRQRLVSGMHNVGGYIIYDGTDIHGITIHHQWSHLVRWIDYGETVHDEYITSDGNKEWLHCPGLERTRVDLSHYCHVRDCIVHLVWEPSHVNMVLRKQYVLLLSST